jgi:hypothetical protein
MMLKTFSNQNDGVALLAKSQNSDQATQVLYSNKAF